MTSNEIYARVKDNEFVNAPTHRVNVIDENGVIRLSRPCWGLDMAESIAADREGEIDGWTVEIVELENRDEIQAYLDKENTETPNPDNTPSTMNANDIRESISRLRYELQQYINNESKGGSERRRNMILLRWDIRRLERQLKAMDAETRTKSMNGKSAKDLERQIARISGARFDKALKIYSRYLHNIAVYFSGDKYPHAPAMTPDQLKIKVPQSIYAAI